MSTITSKVAKSLPIGGPAAWLLFIFFGLLIVVNAAYTTAFGATYMGQVLKSSVLGGGMTVLFLDFAALCWFVARRYHAGNKQQLDISKSLAIATLVGSCILTLAQIGMNVGTDAAEAATSGVGWWVGFSGLVVVTLFAIANIVAGFGYAYYSPAELDKEVKRLAALEEQEEAQELAREAAADLAADKARKKMIQRRAKEQRQRLMDEAMVDAEKEAAEEIYQNKPVMVRALVQQATTEYYRAAGMDDVIKRAQAIPEPKAITEAELNALVAAKVDAQLKAQQGAAAGAKKKSKKRGKKKTTSTPKAVAPAPAPLPLESKTEPGKCACGLPIGDAAGQCTAATCMIDQEAQATAIDRIHDVYVQEMGTKDGLSETYNQFATKYADQFPNDGRANPKSHSFAWADYLTVLKEDALPLGADSYLRTDDEIALAEAAAASRLEADETPGK